MSPKALLRSFPIVALAPFDESRFLPSRPFQTASRKFQCQYDTTVEIHSQDRNEIPGLPPFPHLNQDNRPSHLACAPKLAPKFIYSQAEGSVAREFCRLQKGLLVGYTFAPWRRVLIRKFALLHLAVAGVFQSDLKGGSQPRLPGLPNSRLAARIRAGPPY